MEHASFTPLVLSATGGGLAWPDRFFFRVLGGGKGLVSRSQTTLFSFVCVGGVLAKHTPIRKKKSGLAMQD